MCGICTCHYTGYPWAGSIRYSYREKRTADFIAGRYCSGNAHRAGTRIMLNELGVQVYLVTGYTDLRRSIDGLAAIVQAQLKLDPYSKALFLFCGRRCDRIKGLL